VGTRVESFSQALLLYSTYFPTFYTILKKLNENLSTRKSHFTDSERENWERYKTRGYEWNSPHYLKLDQIELNQPYGTFKIMRP